MPAKKSAGSPPGASTTASTRKPWKKKTPAELMIEQAEKMRKQVAEKEEELKELRRQLQKFEEARKLFEE